MLYKPAGSSPGRANIVLRYHWIVAILLTSLFFGLSFGAMQGDSAIVDELAHIPAGYSYNNFGDYRLNPEHPPLLKNLSALPLQFLDLVFPTDSESWTSKVNDQYGVGYKFIYEYGNNAKQLIFWARLPLLLLATAFALVFYTLIRKRFGTAVGLIALFFYSLSPNIIAHAHYVTTDVGATIAIFLALIAMIRYFEVPSKKSIFILTLGLGFAQLTKFSSVLLYPFMLIMWICVVVFIRSVRPWKLLGGILLASIGSVIIIYLWYVPNTINMSAKSQSDIFYMTLYSGIGPAIAQTLAPLSVYPFLKPILHYILGLAMVLIRVENGNVTYFNGAIGQQSYLWYFPEIFLLKTQVPFLILLSGLPLLALLRFGRISHKRFSTYLKYHRFEFVMASFVVFYFTIAVTGNLNLGIRHILPIYPPLFVLVALGCVRIVRVTLLPKKWVVAGISVLLVWYGLGTIFSYPSYTAYFNGLLGGPSRAINYFSDSGVDWGQDLDRLKSYVDDHPEISKIAVDYFGGGVPRYTFCEQVIGTNGRILAGEAGYDCSSSKYVEWHSNYGKYTGSYIAVSETYLINDLYYSKYDKSLSYEYLRSREPVARIGNSIYVYKLE